MNENFQHVYTIELPFDIPVKRIVKTLELYKNRPNLFDNKILGSKLRPVDNIDLYQHYSFLKLSTTIYNIWEVEFIPKNSKFLAAKTLIFDDYKNKQTFYVPFQKNSKIVPDFPYLISYDKKFSCYAPNTSIYWNNWLRAKLNLVYHFFAKSKNFESQVLAFPHTSYDLSTFNRVYNELKVRFASILSTNWSLPTDPSKHIYEEMAIASYLITIWQSEAPGNLEVKKEDGQFKYKFLDMGCGNGLLTFFLTASGYKGRGIDVRERKTWPILTSMAPNLDLQVTSLDPSQRETIFPEYEWLLGNHSDELTPWIPHLSAKIDSLSSSKPLLRNKVFIMPCCPFDFYGKYQRKRSNLSHYEDYLIYITRELCFEKYGFDVYTDKLRIPSTKRICIIGYPSKSTNLSHLTQSSDILGKLVDISPTMTACNDDDNDDQNTLKEAKTVETEITPLFVARPSYEPVRNCTQIDKNLIQEILKLVLKLILNADQSNFLKIRRNDNINHIQNTETLENLLCWHAGGTVAINEIVPHLTEPHKAALKSQNGGLRTLIKNYGHIFSVKGENVTLAFDASRINLTSVLSTPNNITQNYQKLNMTTRKSNTKVKTVTTFIKSQLCWLNENHPQACPYSKIKCKYAHGKTDLIVYDRPYKKESQIS